MNSKLFICQQQSSISEMNLAQKQKIATENTQCNAFCNSESISLSSLIASLSDILKEKNYVVKENQNNAMW